MPLWMSIPECPPEPPVNRTRSCFNPSAMASGSYVPDEVTSTPPAQPIEISSSSSVSKLSRMSPCRNPPFNPKAPVMPVSSSMVNRASMAGWGMSLESKMAKMAATPIPLSAPSVVPSARTQSPSTYILMPCVSKSKSVSAFFWHTMSRWLCNTMCRLPSMPGVAGLRIKTFPTSSVWVSNPQFLPKSMTQLRTSSSFFEGRGMRFSSLK